MVIDSGGIDIEPSTSGKITGKGKITSSVDFIGLRFFSGIGECGGITIDSIIADSTKRIGLHVSGKHTGAAVLVIRGNESNTYTGDAIVSGANNHIGLGKNRGKIAI
ncbi:hypothetical protein [Cephaloticoccus primus]|uniref:hypothetical protein n=1 Tax=Cephaloticoccus primus TaxID=1548207 RepID=UPI0012E90139|nr:hypothetical protein [Cephaloticoccus primus]